MASSLPSGKALHVTGTQARPAPAAPRCPPGRSGAGWCRRSRTACARPRAPPGAWARARCPRLACRSQTSRASGAAQRARLGHVRPSKRIMSASLIARAYQTASLHRLLRRDRLVLGMGMTGHEWQATTAERSNVPIQGDNVKNSGIRDTLQSIPPLALQRLVPMREGLRACRPEPSRLIKCRSP